MTVMISDAVAVPAGLLAVTVYPVPDCVAEGLPVIMPVVLFSDRPAIKAGNTVKLSTTPVTVALFVAIATPCQ